MLFAEATIIISGDIVTLEITCLLMSGTTCLEDTCGISKLK